MCEPRYPEEVLAVAEWGRAESSAIDERLQEEDRPLGMRLVTVLPCHLSPGWAGGVITGSRDPGVGAQGSRGCEWCSRRRPAGVAQGSRRARGKRGGGRPHAEVSVCGAAGCRECLGLTVGLSSLKRDLQICGKFVRDFVCVRAAGSSLYPSVVLGSCLLFGGVEKGVGYHCFF